MSVLSAVKDFIKTYDGLDAGAPVTSDYSGAKPTWYSIVPLSANPVIEKFVNGGSRRQFLFAFQSMEYTADELERLDNVNFFELFSEWLDEQTEAGVLPTLSADKTAEMIEAVDWGYLYEQGQSETGIYQIVCRLEYTQIAPIAPAESA